MTLWPLLALAFFAYVAIVLAWQGPRGRPVLRVAAGAAIGSSIVGAWGLSGEPSFLTDWIWPPLVLLTAYWTSGLLFVAPVPWQERALGWLDDRLDLFDVARRTPRGLAELFEAAYTGVYVLVPIALAVQGHYAPDATASRFWDVILITDFICFGMLPWVQTRPPRALEGSDPWTSSIRRWNLRLLGTASIRVNTFPSGHAAEALASFLLVVDAPLPVTVPMFLAAVAVSAGAVLGRYHYLADAIAGWVVALAVVMMLR
jgi:membrane-associated phospholipid phosphatase